VKFCLVTETYPPHVNGVARTVSALQNSLLELGHHVQLIRPRFGTLDHPRKMHRLEEILTSGPSSINFLNLPISAPSSAALRMLWIERRPDLIHLATEGPLGFSALRTAHQLEIPVTSDFRTNAHLYVRHHGLGILSRLVLDYLRYFHNRTLITTVPTEGLRSYLSDSGFSNLKVLGRGIDAQAYSPCHRSDALRMAWGASKDDFVLLFVGRLIPEKNLVLLANAYQAVLRRDRSVKLVVVGDGPGRDYLQSALPTAINRAG
jgi:glycosyltransferase involved in cell wall biosynthesis